MTAVSTRVKAKKAPILIRSAMAPDTIEAVAATNTIWKNQSDMTENPFLTTLTVAAAVASPFIRATSAADDL